MRLVADLIAKVRFFPSSEGGRRGPTTSGRFGCILEFDGGFHECRLLLGEVGPLWPGQEAVVAIKFLYPDLAKPRLKGGDKFYLREDRRIAEGNVERLL
ncbi:MAG: hypothetical protein EWM72_03452 [Nitrospira sp.]|nr:MAG: hypothetical protein EWM72_03452 [Nitrospira sp.]